MQFFYIIPCRCGFPLSPSYNAEVEVRGHHIGLCSKPPHTSSPHFDRVSKHRFNMKGIIHHPPPRGNEKIAAIRISNSH